jgi:hypothetical protein
MHLGFSCFDHTSPCPMAENNCFYFPGPFIQDGVDNWTAPFDLNHQVHPGLHHDSTQGCQSLSDSASALCSPPIWTTEMGSQATAEHTSEQGSSSEPSIPKLKAYPCSKLGCQKSYTRNEALQTHISSTHRGEKPNVCRIDGCLKAFATLSDCKKHRKTHQSEEKSGARIRCMDCSNTFGRRDSLLEHRREHCRVLRARGCLAKRDESAYKSRSTSAEGSTPVLSQSEQGFAEDAARSIESCPDLPDT